MTDTIVTTRELPWLSIATKMDGPMTTGEAIQKASLDWTVSKRPLLYKREDGSGLFDVNARFAVVRDTDEHLLGVVGSHYVLFQNREAFEFADELVSGGRAIIHAAGTMRGGRVIFLVMKLNGDQIMVAGDDAHDMYLLLRTSHDASKAIGAYITMIRIHCTNQMQLITSTAKQKWAVPHVQTVKGRLEEAQVALKLTDKYAESFKATADRLASIDLEIDEFRDVLTHVLPIRPKTPEVIERVVQIYETSTTNDHQGNAWGALNALTEYYDWGRDTKSAEARFLSSVDGVGSVIRNRTASLLLRRGAR
jgi:phage/plasmid-like protein (TIGR03299 family)